MKLVKKLHVQHFDQGGWKGRQEDGWQEDAEIIAQQPACFMKNPQHAPASDFSKDALHLALSLQQLN